ncbi:ABC transporter permease subunit [Candidatus Riflebacteria bacterium]
MFKAIRVIIIKDIKSILHSWKVWLPLIFLPFIFVIFMPSLLFYKLAYFKADNLQDIETMLKYIPHEYIFTTHAQKAAFAFSHYFFPTLLLVIPIMTSTILAANSFAGEKEQNTLESLLYTPLSLEELFFGKILGVFIPSYFVTLLSFIALAFISNYWMMKILPVYKLPLLRWGTYLFILCPTIVILGLTFSVWVSANCSTFQEAQQLSSLVVFPIILIIIGQANGLFVYKLLHLVFVAIFFVLLDLILIYLAAKSFTYERLLS